MKKVNRIFKLWVCELLSCQEIAKVLSLLHGLPSQLRSPPEAPTGHWPCWDYGPMRGSPAFEKHACAIPDPRDRRWREQTDVNGAAYTVAVSTWVSVPSPLTASIRV